MAHLGVETVDTVIADPPYGIDYQSYRSLDKSRRTPKIANDKAPFVWFLPQAYKLLKPNRSALVFCRWDVSEAFRQALGWAGYSVRGQVVWDRDWHGMGDLTTTYAPQHDLIWHANKGRHPLPHPRPRSVMRIKRLSAQALTHPNEKPVELMEALILSCTNPGDTVLDPFMGSGATGVAAVRTGRHFIGIELDGAYFLAAQERIRKEEANVP